MELDEWEVACCESEGHGVQGRRVVNALFHL